MSDILQICCFQDASYVKDTVSHKVTFKCFKQVMVGRSILLNATVDLVSHCIGINYHVQKLGGIGLNGNKVKQVKALDKFVHSLEPRPERASVSAQIITTLSSGPGS